MKVYFKDNEGAARYRNVSFIGETPTEVTPEWFEACSNPRIVEAKDKPKKSTSKTAKAD